jgi:3-oxoacyl-[acyl-carrier protein] reductase
MPGLTLTERVRTSFPRNVSERQAAALPIRRLVTPDELAAAVAFLGSAANAAITGEVVRASGGRT